MSSDRIGRLRDRFNKRLETEGIDSAMNLYLGAIAHADKLARMLSDRSEKLRIAQNQLAKLKKDNGYNKAIKKAAEAIGMSEKSLRAMIKGMQK